MEGGWIGGSLGGGCSPIQAEEIQLFEARMPFLVNFFATSRRRLVMLGTGLASLFQVASIALAGVFGSRGTAKERIKAALRTPRSQRLVFDVLRAFLPNMVLARQLITSYENKGTAITVRRDDVLDVLSRDGEFEVVYEPRMREITGGENFFLGMQIRRTTRATARTCGLPHAVTTCATSLHRSRPKQPPNSSPPRTAASTCRAT